MRHLRAPGGLQMAPPGSIDKLEGHQETLVPNRLRKESADKRRRRQAGDREARREGHGGELLHATFSLLRTRLSSLELVPHACFRPAPLHLLEPLLEQSAQFVRLFMGSGRGVCQILSRWHTEGAQDVAPVCCSEPYGRH